MKCLILAGGKGGRIWPLSRKNYPKQFIQIQRQHSIFQEMISNNIALCDEFVIVTNKEYQFIVEYQMQAFQGITYRCVYEEAGRNTTAAVALACQSFPSSEIIYMVLANQLILGNEYREEVLKAKSIAQQGKIAVLEGEKAVSSIQGKMMMFQAGDFLHELEKYMPEFHQACMAAYKTRKVVGKNVLFEKETLSSLPALDITQSILARTNKAVYISCSFCVQDVDNLENLDAINIESSGKIVDYKGSHNLIINQCKNELVLANEIEDTVVVNTTDAIYIGKKGKSQQLKNIIKGHPEIEKFFEKSSIYYRHWGTYEILHEDTNLLVKKVRIESGETIYSHKHRYRKEHWIIVQGNARITLEGKMEKYCTGDCINIDISQVHQVSNIGTTELLIIEVATGSNVHEEDMVSILSKDITEAELGMPQDNMVKLLPVFKDYLWGGTKLRDYLNKKCDYTQIAESWEVSAHSAGQSIVGSGKYKGIRFRDYLDAIGNEKLGWKCSSMKNFPILVKFIDAKENLSVQVHPDDEFAWEVEKDSGKNEMWYVMDAEEGAGIYLGFRKEMTVQEVRDKIEDNTILKEMRWIPAQKGDAFFIEAGTVHAIGKGMLVCEIQQSSNITYRLFDYGRRDRYGKLRELHLDKALSVINYNTLEKKSKLSGNEWGCKYFKCKKYDFDSEIEIEVDESSFKVFIFISGKAEVHIENEIIIANLGESIFIPAGIAKAVIYGKGSLLCVDI